MVQILCARSKSQLEAIDVAYRRDYKTTLVQYIEKEMGGNLSRFLLYTQMLEPEFDSFLIDRAVSGIGCDKDSIVEILTTRPFERIQAAR